MNRMRKLLYLISFISYSFAFCILLTALSGLTAMPLHYFSAYILLAIGLVLVFLSGDVLFRKNWQKTSYVAGLLLVAAASLYELLIDGAGFMQFSCFTLAGFMLLYRIYYFASISSDFREVLWNSTRSEIAGILTLYPVILVFAGSSFFKGSADWQAKLLALFAGFLFFRLFALSLCYRLNTGRNLTPLSSFLFIILFGGIFYGLAQAWGFSMFDAALRSTVFLLRPILLGIGYLLQLLLDQIDAASFQAAFNKVVPQYQPGNEELLPNANIQSASAGSDWLVYVVFCSLLLYAAWFVYKKRHTASTEGFQNSDAFIEVREFLLKSPEAEQYPQQFSKGSLSEMRKTYRRLLKLLRKSGYTPISNETAFEFASKVSRHYPSIGKEMHEITTYYSEVRYGEIHVHDMQNRADQILEEIRKEL